MGAQVTLSPPGWAMIGMLVLCTLALLGLVVTLPGVRGFFGKLLHIGMSAGAGAGTSAAPDSRHSARA